MKFVDAIKKCRELGDLMTNHADAAQRASRTYAATMELYNVAAESGDEAAMQAHRDTLHTTVDIILDSGAMIGKLTKEQRGVANTVSDFPQQF